MPGAFGQTLTPSYYKGQNQTLFLLNKKYLQRVKNAMKYLCYSF